MPRLMSVAHTEAAVVDRSKTVTRRLGWQNLKPATRLQLVRKAMGRKRRDGTVEPLVRLELVDVVSVRRERLDAILTYPDPDAEARAEGVPGVSTAVEFVEFYCRAFKVRPSDAVTRIEWRYVHHPSMAKALRMVPVDTGSLRSSLR